LGGDERKVSPEKQSKQTQSGRVCRRKKKKKNNELEFRGKKVQKVLASGAGEKKVIAAFEVRGDRAKIWKKLAH